MTVSNPLVDAAVRMGAGFGAGAAAGAGFAACCARPNVAAHTTSPVTRSARMPPGLYDGPEVELEPSARDRMPGSGTRGSGCHYV